MTDYPITRSVASIKTALLRLALVTERLERVERALGTLSLDNVSPKVAAAIVRAWLDARPDVPDDDPLRVAMLRDFVPAPCRFSLGYAGGWCWEHSTFCAPGPTHSASSWLIVPEGESKTTLFNALASWAKAPCDTASALPPPPPPPPSAALGAPEPGSHRQRLHPQEGFRRIDGTPFCMPEIEEIP